MTNRTRSIVQSIAILLMTAFLASCGNDSPGTSEDPVTTEAFYADPADEWVLVWSDEFDGDSLDLSKWGYELGDGTDFGLQPGWGNQESQYYTDANATVADGTLTIEARNESVAAGFPYTSSRISTKGKLNVKYGRIEASIKAPAGQGMWSAFWMLSSNSPYGSDGWAATGEIDIFEAINPTTGTDLDFTGSTIYHGFPWPLQQFLNFDAGVDATTDFNVYAVEWEAQELRFFVNDTHISTVTSDSYYSYYYDDADPGYKLAPDGAPFDTPFHILLNLAVGGNATGNSVDDDALPGAMEVDYVRVYECVYGLADGSGCNVNSDRTLETPDDLRPGTASFDVYIDAPAVYTWEILDEVYERPLGLASFWDNDGALMVAEIADPNGGMMIDVMTAGGGNISIYSADPDGETIGLFGMGNAALPFELHAAELRFDLYIDSANTDADGTFQVKMDSGFPALGFVDFNIADLPQDTWTTVSVKLNDIMQNPGEQPIDFENVVSMFVFEPGFTTSLHVWIDNITLSCGNPGSCGISAPVPPAPPIEGSFRFPGTWVMTPENGSFGVGPAEGDVAWWFNGIDGDNSVETRSCFFDDEYVFTAEGQFNNVLQDETWLEGWQGVAGEGCGAPISPHDGLSDYTWEYDEGAGTLTLTGTGAYMGIPKAVNGQELGNVADTPSSVTYNVVEDGNSNVRLTVESGGGVWWTFNFTKTVDAPGDPEPELPPFAGTWMMDPINGSFGVGPTQGDTGWWFNGIDGDDSTVTRDCFFDDEYVFTTDGQFNNVLQDETWIEGWQSGNPDGCAAPLSPHDGLSDYSYAYDEGAGTLTLTGVGAYMGIPKAVNGQELGNVADAPASTTYLVNFADSETVQLDIETAAGVWWGFRFIRTESPVAPPSGPAVAGTWIMDPVNGSFGVGPTQGDTGWWFNGIDGDDSTMTRDCFFDDSYVLGSGGEFNNVLGTETWIEGWQSGNPDGCAAPVSPHDGLSDYTYTYDEGAGTLTINGTGGYLGIPKAVNGLELGNVADTPSSVTYLVALTDPDTMVVDIETAAGVWWGFRLVRQ